MVNRNLTPEELENLKLRIKYARTPNADDIPGLARGHKVKGHPIRRYDVINTFVAFHGEYNRGDPHRVNDSDAKQNGKVRPALVLAATNDETGIILLPIQHAKGANPAHLKRSRIGRIDFANETFDAGLIKPSDILMDQAFVIPKSQIGVAYYRGQLDRNTVLTFTNDFREFDRSLQMQELKDFDLAKQRDIILNPAPDPPKDMQALDIEPDFDF